MNQLLTLFIPFFGVILVGYGVGRFRVVPGEGLAALEFFIFKIALPALLFHLVVTTQTPLSGGWSFIATTTFATYCAFAIAFSIGALVNGGNVTEATVEGLIGSYSNTAYLAPTLVLAALGTAAAAPMALIYSFDTAMLLIVTPLMMALGGTMRSDPRKLAEEIGREVLLNPGILATLLGFIALGFGLSLPGPVEATLASVGTVAGPGALFLLGVTLSRRSLRPVTLDLPVVVAVKLVGHPLIVYLLLSWVGAFDPIWVNTAVLIAALPPAGDVVRLAGRYRIAGDRASAAILVASIAAVVTLVVTTALLLGSTSG
jgi:predicted permease